MTLHFFEGFETVGTEVGLANQATTRPRIDLRWDSTTVGGIPSTDSYFLIQDVFAEGYAIQMGNNGFSNGNSLIWFFPTGTTATDASATTFIMGCRLHVPSTARTWDVFQIRDGTSNNTHLAFKVTNSADFSAWRNLAGSALGSASAVFTPGDWHYVEVKWKIGDSPHGLVEAYVDGVQVFSASSVDTKDFFSNVSRLRFHTTNASTGEDFVGFDDIYVLTVDATAPNDYLGAQARVLSLPPNADGTTTDWTPSSGSDHYALIDENGADAADYIESNTNAQVDMFEITNPSAGGQFVAVKIEAEAIDTSAGANSIDVRVDSNGTVDETEHNVTSTSAYDVFAHYQMTDPDTGSAWTLSGINNLEVGVKFNT